MNLFDTYRAAKYINEYPYHLNNKNNNQNQTKNHPTTTTTKKFKSLGYAGIVKHYISNQYPNYILNKQYQLSDWRIRPLPNDMIHYAILDTYYLITIYEYIKYDLYQECGDQAVQAMINVLDICKDVSLIRYCPPPFDPYGYQSLLLSSSSW